MNHFHKVNKPPPDELVNYHFINNGLLKSRRICPLYLPSRRKIPVGRWRRIMAVIGSNWQRLALIGTDWQSYDPFRGTNEAHRGTNEAHQRIKKA